MLGFKEVVKLRLCDATDLQGLTGEFRRLRGFMTSTGCHYSWGSNPDRRPYLILGYLQATLVLPVYQQGASILHFGNGK